MDASQVIFSQLYLQWRDSLYQRAFRLFGGDFDLTDRYLAGAICSAYDHFVEFSPGKMGFDDFVIDHLMKIVQNHAISLPHPLVYDVDVAFSVSCARQIEERLGVDLENLKFRADQGASSDFQGSVSSAQPIEAEGVEFVDQVSPSSVRKVGVPYSVLSFAFACVLFLFAFFGYSFFLPNVEEEHGVQVVSDGDGEVAVSDEIGVPDEVVVSDVIQEYTESGDLKLEMESKSVPEIALYDMPVVSSVLPPSRVDEIRQSMEEDRELVLFRRTSDRLFEYPYSAEEIVRQWPDDMVVYFDFLAQGIPVLPRY